MCGDPGGLWGSGPGQNPAAARPGLPLPRGGPCRPRPCGTPGGGRGMRTPRQPPSPPPPWGANGWQRGGGHTGVAVLVGAVGQTGGSPDPGTGGSFSGLARGRLSPGGLRAATVEAGEGAADGDMAGRTSPTPGSCPGHPPLDTAAPGHNAPCSARLGGSGVAIAGCDAPGGPHVPVHPGLVPRVGDKRQLQANPLGTC